MSKIDFSALLYQQEHLYKGRPSLLMRSDATLAESARAIAEQRRDILYLFSDLDAEQIEALDESLEIALQGLQTYAEALAPLRTMAKELQESNSPDIPPLGEALERLRENAADQATILKSLYQVTQKFIDAQPNQ